MQLSPDTESVLSYFQDLVEGGLRKRTDVGVLLELGATTNSAELFNTIVTTGTAVHKVYGTLRRVKPGDAGFRELEREFGMQLNALRELIATLLETADDNTLRRFDDVYFGLSQGVMRNLVDLSHDLARIKELQRGA